MGQVVGIGIGVHLNQKPGLWTLSESLAELKELAQTAQLTLIDTITQNRSEFHPRTYIGEGKLEELAELIHKTGAEVVVADDELKPVQQKNLETRLKVKILDRTGLILDIFANRAQTKEAQLQIELAQLQYLLPRLTRMWTHLSRLGGGIGTRGPGEKQLEVDKRQIRRRISAIKKDIDQIKKHRARHRERRKNRPLLSAAIVGYTNAGKSTLMNRLTQANVQEENQLFSTLDPTTRSIKLPNKDPLLLTDTVGFIQKLPHQLVTAFRATLEESLYADILVHVVDASHPKAEAMIQTANQILNELDVTDKPTLMVFNKIDQLTDPTIAKTYCSTYSPSCAISAKNNLGIDTLISELNAIAQAHHKKMTFFIPYARQDVVHLLHEHGVVLDQDYADTIRVDVDIHAIIGEKIMGQLNRP